MKISASTSVLTALSFVVSANPDVDVDALLKRQEPGSAAYSCHAACGGVLTIGRAGGEYCDNPKYQSNLQACLDCANSFGIWSIYGNGVSALAGQCQDDATPSPSGFASAGPSSTAASSGTDGSSKPTPTAAESTPISSMPTETGAAVALEFDSGASMFAILIGMFGVLACEKIFM